MDYGALTANVAELDAYLAQLGAPAKADVAAFSYEQAVAYWINAYNAFTLKSIVERYPVKSIKDISGVWDKRKWKAGGDEVTLDQIEHGLLRPLGDPRVHAAINCASVGCPPLADGAYTGGELNKQLDAAARRWAQSKARNTFDPGKKEAHVTKIFKWFGEDFVKGYHQPGRFPKLSDEESAAVSFLYKYATDADRKIIDAGIEDVDYLDYDWGLNDAK
ncbi:MAG: DUF547 domain-containing protein [Deltaproteobacteria bacterium]|nr:DUF547 domain-containing protein [Deltaproteobacteria bacterium]